ncbi:exodeoxyribonuclease V subunit beta [Candidatus Thiosymbion oneisti]|uniref:exodeoxyribonuclease V subunit beta n=1 Tax=Candidatus Thiosymbion oneisti TaxID=589554 RepID=UPI000B7EFAB5|nr:exodeoxyribonuclease V subunit beta [Candidatus Thiosymbion oneisti]
MIALDPLRIPLRGLTLIEASAGTGKTYSITTLYLRLLLELGLEVDRILVVTFTEAATEELRDRIRRRLVQALDWFRGGVAVRGEEGEGGDRAGGDEQDPILVQLLSGLPDRDRARTLLTDALTRMDEAAIHTIHGFCLRILGDHAFESGAAFDAEFITDETRLRTTAVADFWRRQVAGADPRTACRVREHWKTPQDLLADLQSTLALEDLRLLPPVDAAGIEAARRELDAVFAQLQTQWHAASDQVADILATNPALNRRSYTKQVVAQAVRTAATLAAATEPPASLPAGCERLTPAGLARGTKAGQPPPAHPFFDLCGRLSELSVQVHTGTRALFLTSARAFVRADLERRKEDEGLLYYDDLLRRLDQALAGDGSEALAAGVRARYPVALIDEFQDTDPQQYRIFHRLYGRQPDCGLFLIGDPKQAIYAFRGADIFTYMQARDDSARTGHRYGLTVNRRSGSRLIEAVNCLFASAREPFIYQDYIGFEPVAPGPKADEKPLRIQGVEPVPLQVWMLRLDEENQTLRPPGFIRNDAALSEAAQACAGYIADLLNQADAGAVTIGDSALRPSDIALLVRTHREGDLVQQALRARGISSVSLSEDSVFATEDAEELTTLLQALAAPHDPGRVRAALATSLLGRNAAELARLADDELAWEKLLARFQSYRERWRQQGIMAALQALLTAEQIPARLLRRPDGERRLTNLLQLLELLQVAAGEHPGLDGLLRWLSDRRGSRVGDAAQQLRLESDEGLVKVVTLHKSKGLEYPLVFIPFPWSAFKGSQGQAPVFFHAPENKQACLDLGSSDRDAHARLERTERLAEQLRLFYVGVTRAAKRCVLCWGKVNGIRDAALAYLLHQDPESELPTGRIAHLSEAEIRADLDALATRAPDAIEIRELPLPTGGPWRGGRIDPAQLAPKKFHATIDGGWRVASYSGLVRGDESERPDFDAAAGPPVPETEPGTPADPVFAFPAGVHAGHFLHQLFEDLDFPHAAGETLTQAVRDLLHRYGGLSAGRAADRDWAPVVEELVTKVLDTWLDPAESLRLRDITAADRISELEFHFPVAGLSPKSLDAALAVSEAHADAAQGLGFEPMRGLMHGFIDLVFRRRGRFYILDYKSNRLGDRLTAYGQDGLRIAIRRHRYHLQYLIYTLALHRFLGWRLPDYDYRTHFGGVYYLFLRGMHPHSGPRYGVWYDRPSYDLIAALDRLFAGGPG